MQHCKWTFQVVWNFLHYFLCTQSFGNVLIQIDGTTNCQKYFKKGLLRFCFRLWNQLVSHVPKRWMGNSDLGWRFCEIWDVLALKWGQCVTKGTPSLAEYCTNIWVRGINEWIQSGYKVWGWWGGSEKKMDKCRVIWCYWVSLNQSMFIQNQRQ